MKKLNFSKKVIPFLGMAVFCALMMCTGINVKAANAQPTDLKQTAATANKVSISWTAPSTQAGNTYNRIIVQCSKDNKTWVDKGYVASNITSATLIGIERGTSQYVRIKAVNFDAGTNKITEDGAWSEVIDVATIPYSISGISQTAAGKTSVSFTWPEAKGANCYDVYIGSSYSNAKFVVRMTGRTLTVKGRKQGYGYNVKVVPIRLTEKQYAAAGMETWGTVKTVPKTVTVSKENLWERGSKSIEFSWTSANKKVDGYELKIYDSKGKAKATVRTNKTSYTFKKAQNNQYYKIKVRPYINVNGKRKYGAWSKKAIALTAPQITGVIQEDNKATIKWSAVKGADSYAIYAGTYPDVDSMTKIATVKSGDTSFVTDAVGNTAVATNKRIYFCVKAQKTSDGKTYVSLASDAGFSN